MKQIIKDIVPPILYSFLRRKFSKPRTFSPEWCTLEYKPLKGIQIFFDPTGPWQKTILTNTYDSFLFKRLSPEKLAGKVVYDIGAHIGFHSLYFARLVGPKGKVYAFEPNPKNVERLDLIREKNPDIKNIVTVLPVAVSNVLGTEEFSMSEDIESGRSSGGFIDTADTIWERGAFKVRGFAEIKVKTVPMDLFKKELGINELPDLIKMDIEGAESLALLGGKNTLLNKKPLILLEVHSILNMFNVMKFLSSLSYETEIIKEESDGRCFIEARPK